MRKLSASTAYGLYKQANRLREAIRSGELSGPEAEVAKRRMGIDPMREAIGLETGAKNIAQAKGFSVHDYGPGYMTDIKEKLLRGNLQTKREGIVDLARSQGAKLMGGAITLPDYRGIPGMGNYMPAPQIIINRPATERNFKRLGMNIPEGDFAARDMMMANTLSHEANEARYGKKYTDMLRKKRQMPNPNAEHLYRVTNPVFRELEQPVKRGPVSAAIEKFWSRLGPSADMGLLGGQHMAPEVVLHETRNARMLSPEVQQAWGNIRNTTGEAAHMQHASPRANLGQTLLSPGYGERSLIPKKQIGGMAQNMRAVAREELPQARRAVSGLLGGGVEKVLAKPMSLLSRFAR